MRYILGVTVAVLMTVMLAMPVMASTLVVHVDEVNPGAKGYAPGSYWFKATRISGDTLPICNGHTMEFSIENTPQWGTVAEVMNFVTQAAYKGKSIMITVNQCGGITTHEVTQVFGAGF